MGLFLTHNCFMGSYRSFNQWRRKVACYAGYPPIDLMEGYCDPRQINTESGEDSEWSVDDLPIPWAKVKWTPLHLLLNHSDCDGRIEWEVCRSIADELDKTLRPGETHGDEEYMWLTGQFITGLRSAADSRENIEFF